MTLLTALANKNKTLFKELNMSYLLSHLDNHAAMHSIFISITLNHDQSSNKELGFVFNSLKALNMR